MVKLKLTDVHKTYRNSEIVHALKGVSLDFRENEFVSILGPSGCGKTTLLNVVGGLDHYDSGDLNISGLSTKNFNDADWDAYRNRSIGFVFQNYNLIGHQTVLQNVEIAMTLSGVSVGERRRRAKEALTSVGLSDQAKKKPNQLSGGQMQRVAIARALVNNPEIILADEPTGALDSHTSVQVMEILKEIAKTKLVIMVTHNSELANEYSKIVNKCYDGGRFVTIADLTDASAKIAYVYPTDNITSVLQEGFGEPNGKPLYRGHGVMACTFVKKADDFSGSENFAAYASPLKLDSKNKCMRCGSCSRKCPVKIKTTKIVGNIDKNNLAACAAYNPERCIQCGSCTYYCPASKNVSGYMAELLNK